MDNKQRIIDVSDPKFTNGPKGDSLSFTVTLRFANGSVAAIVDGCRVYQGLLFGPSYRSKAGRYIPQVRFVGLREFIIDALKETPWPRDYATVKWLPELTPKEKTDGK